jgi:hypothetical protein
LIGYGGRRSSYPCPYYLAAGNATDGARIVAEKSELECVRQTIRSLDQARVLAALVPLGERHLQGTVR